MDPTSACSMFNCRNESVGTISRYGDAGYCYPHLISLAKAYANKRPKPVITYYESFDPNSLEQHESVSPKERLTQITSLKTETWSESWKLFRQKHYEVPSLEKATGNYRRITCACGWKNDLWVNSGIALGVRIAWQNHFYAVNPQFISKGSFEAPSEVTEVLKCEKCEKPSETIVEKSWTSEKSRNQSLCAEHSLEFEDLPGFKVIKLNNWVSPTGSRIYSEELEIEQMITPVASRVTLNPVREPKKPTNKFFKSAVIVLSLFLVGGLLVWNDGLQRHNQAVAELESRNAIAATCFQIEEEDQASRAGGVGTKAREDAVIAFYDKVLSSTCVEWGDGTILDNLFYKATESSPNWQDLKNAFTYSLQKWNGIELMSIRCADGWSSPSIGKQGACSHHGGVTSGFSTDRDSDISKFLSNGEQIYPALYILEDATK